MTESMFETVITGGLSLLGIVITSVASIRAVAKKFETKMEVAMAVQNTKLDELAREVREHNGFARRMPVVESEIKHIEDEVSHLKKYHSQ